MMFRLDIRQKFRVSPEWDGIRDDPRFAEIVK
jgi:hypothetical protein